MQLKSQCQPNKLDLTNILKIFVIRSLHLLVLSSLTEKGKWFKLILAFL